MRTGRQSEIGKDAKSNCMPMSLEHKKGIVTVYYTFLKDNDEFGKGYVVFKRIFAYRFTPGHPPMDSDILEGYDNVYVKEDSDWLKSKLDKLKEEEIPAIPLPKWKHHILYFDDEGYYEVIADSYEIVEE